MALLLLALEDLAQPRAMRVAEQAAAERARSLMAQAHSARSPLRARSERSPQASTSEKLSFAYS